MKRIVTSEPIQDRYGKPVSRGYVQFQLHGHFTLAGGGYVLPLPLSVQLDKDGKIQDEFRVHGNDEMKQEDAVYRVTVQTQAGTEARPDVALRVESDGEEFDLAKAINPKRNT